MCIVGYVAPYLLEDSIEKQKKETVDTKLQTEGNSYKSISIIFMLM